MILLIMLKNSKLFWKGRIQTLSKALKERRNYLQRRIKSHKMICLLFFITIFFFQFFIIFVTQTDLFVENCDLKSKLRDKDHENIMLQSKLESVSCHKRSSRCRCNGPCCCSNVSPAQGDTSYPVIYYTRNVKNYVEIKVNNAYEIFKFSFVYSVCRVWRKNETRQKQTWSDWRKNWRVYAKG